MPQSEYAAALAAALGFVWSFLLQKKNAAMRPHLFCILGI
jgi:hypothetical protein